MTNHALFIGLMSGTSLDGVDGVLAVFSADKSSNLPQILTTTYIPFPTKLRADLMALQAPGENEVEREALAANALARHYAECVTQLLTKNNTPSDAICAIGAHGQTIRHCPESGYTWQTNNPALLAELTGIDVIADFRRRDIAAGGQGAPLVPAFHQEVFGTNTESRVIVNIGGISNISVLTRNKENLPVIGFDTGPGNILMDAWIGQHLGKAYDTNGTWAASGNVIPALLDALLDEPFFTLQPPKSTGRDLFHPEWLSNKLAFFPNLAPVDVQATLATFTATTVANAIKAHAIDAHTIYVCGGGAFNTHLLQQLTQALQALKHTAVVHSTANLNISPNHVEALAFAWLAYRFTHRQPGNLPAVTGANGLRILGALYPAA